MNLEESVKIAQIVFFVVATLSFLCMEFRQWWYHQKHIRLMKRADGMFKDMLTTMGFKEMKPPPDLKVIKEEKDEPIN